uniref:Disease resistance protein RGA2 n=1 Tax=Rhizophora mucronata TaxID=61149 RepID=A0A2P2MWK5_RHIMU
MENEVNNQIFTIQRLHTLYMGWWSPNNIDGEEMQNSLSTFTCLRGFSLIRYIISLSCLIQLVTLYGCTIWILLTYQLKICYFE